MIRKIWRMHSISIKNALYGVLWAAETQPNYVIHLAFSFLALLVGYIVHISQTEFLIFIFLIFTGLAFETVNTAIEVATDAIDHSWRMDIKVAKDVAAGAMLIYAMGAAIVAAVILIPRILVFIK